MDKWDTVESPLHVAQSPGLSNDAEVQHRTPLLFNQNGLYIAFSIPVPSYLTSLKPVLLFEQIIPNQIALKPIALKPIALKPVLLLNR